MSEEYEFEELDFKLPFARIRREFEANLLAIQTESSLDSLIDLSAVLDMGLFDRLVEIKSPLDREAEEKSFLPPLHIESVRSFLLFCWRLGFDLNEQCFPGRDDDGELGIQLLHPLLGLLAINFCRNGEAWLAWSDTSERRGSCKCPASDLLTNVDPVTVLRWLNGTAHG